MNEQIISIVVHHSQNVEVVWTSSKEDYRKSDIESNLKELQKKFREKHSPEGSQH